MIGARQTAQYAIGTALYPYCLADYEQEQRADWTHKHHHHHNLNQSIYQSIEPCSVAQCATKWSLDGDEDFQPIKIV